MNLQRKKTGTPGPVSPLGVGPIGPTTQGAELGADRKEYGGCYIHWAYDLW
jgi:hypothetical protein